jgi:hypothetical protein
MHFAKAREVGFNCVRMEVARRMSPSTVLYRWRMGRVNGQERPVFWDDRKELKEFQAEM